MSKIICNLFGYPTIVEDGKNIHIPTGKLSAFLYYILIKNMLSLHFLLCLT